MAFAGEQVIINGKVRQEWNDSLSTYTEYDINGDVVPGTPRPYTETESAEASLRVNAALFDSNADKLDAELAGDGTTAGLITQLRDLVVRGATTPTGVNFFTIQEIIDAANADINASPAKYINSLARSLIKVSRAVIILAKIQAKDLSTTK